MYICTEFPATILIWGDERVLKKQGFPWNTNDRFFLNVHTCVYSYGLVIRVATPGKPLARSPLYSGPHLRLLPGILSIRLQKNGQDRKNYCAGLWWYMVVCGIYHTIHLVWSQEPGQHCTYSGSFWSTLFYTVLTVAMSDLALWLLRNPETARFFGCLISQANGSLGLPRNKRTVVPLFTFYLKL